MKINNLETFKAKVARGETCYGLCVNSYDAQNAEIAADAGCDFIWVDMEHCPFTTVDALYNCIAVRGTDCASFVRVPWNVNWLLKPILDLAPAGVIVPMVCTAEEAEQAVRACRYPCDGGERGFGTRRATGYGKMGIPEYMEVSHREPMVILQIEHKDAVANLDEILKVPGWDSVCIGPYDLSASYGKAGEFNDPEIQAALYTICEKTRAAGKILGGFITPGFPVKFHFDWRCLGTDTGFLYSGLKSAIASASAE